MTSYRPNCPMDLAYVERNPAWLPVYECRSYVFLDGREDLLAWIDIDNASGKANGDLLAMHLWCVENCTARWTSLNMNDRIVVFRFERENDILCFKLAWGEILTGEWWAGRFSEDAVPLFKFGITYLSMVPKIEAWAKTHCIKPYEVISVNQDQTRPEIQFTSLRDAQLFMRAKWW